MRSDFQIPVAWRCYAHAGQDKGGFHETTKLQPVPFRSYCNIDSVLLFSAAFLLLDSGTFLTGRFGGSCDGKLGLERICCALVVRYVGAGLLFFGLVRRCRDSVQFQSMQD